MSELEPPASEFESAIGAGAFFPSTLSLFVGIAEGPFFQYGDSRDNRLLHHEYLHFVQSSATSYGLNVFLRDLDLSTLTTSTIRKLVAAKEPVVFPLGANLQELSSESRSEINAVKNLRNAVIEDLAILQGAFKYDPTLKQCLVRGKPVSSEENCRVISFQDPSMLDENVPFGARAIMESAASTHESAYLELASQSDEAFAALKEWMATKEENPVYWVANDLVRKACGDDTRYLLLALADLSLCGRVEWNLTDWFASKVDPAQHSPGARFLLALEAAVGLPKLSLLNFKTEYYNVMGDICKKLGWVPPWEMVDNKFLKHMWDAIQIKDVFNAYEGYEIVFSNGFKLRQQYSHNCAMPLHYNLNGGISIVEAVMHAHPPPNLTIAEGKSAFADFAEKAYGKWLINGESFLAVFEASTRAFAIAQKLQQVAWDGRRSSVVVCLLEPANTRKPRPDCSLCSAETGLSGCPCREFIRKTLGIDSSEIGWA